MCISRCGDGPNVDIRPSGQQFSRVDSPHACAKLLFEAAGGDAAVVCARPCRVAAGAMGSAADDELSGSTSLFEVAGAAATRAHRQHDHRLMLCGSRLKPRSAARGVCGACVELHRATRCDCHGWLLQPPSAAGSVRRFAALWKRWQRLWGVWLRCARRPQRVRGGATRCDGCGSVRGVRSVRRLDALRERW